MKIDKIIFSLLLSVLALVVPVSHAAAAFTIDHFTLQQTRRVSRTSYLYTFQADITNNGGSSGTISATLTSRSLHTIVVDGSLEFGEVPAGQRVQSQDTFSILQDRRYSFNEGDLQWDFTFAENPVKALLIGIDGLVYAYVDSVDDANLNEPDTPNFRRLALSRAFVGGLLNTNTQQATSSGPSWSSILTGTWVDQHGVSSNNNRPTQVPSIFARLHDRNASCRTASYVNWSPINTGHMSESLAYMETHLEGVNDDTVTDHVVAELEKAESDLDFIFVQLDEVDGAGHACGYGACNENAVVRADAQLGRMLDAVEAREALYNEQWLVMIVSDHGHRPAGGHGGQSIEERTSVIGVNRPELMNALFTAPADALPLSDEDEQNGLMGYPAATSIVPTLMAYLGYPATAADNFAGASLLNQSGLGAHKLYSTVTMAGDYSSATVTLNWQVGDAATAVVVYREGEEIARLPAGENFFEDVLTVEDMGSGTFDLGYAVAADTGIPVFTSVQGVIGIMPDIEDIIVKGTLVADFDDSLSPFSWVAGTRDEPVFEAGPFAGSAALRTERSLGYATLDRGIAGLTQFSFGFWLKVNGDVTSDPNIIANKDWNSGYNAGFTVAVKNSGIKLNLGDGNSHRADTNWLAYTKDTWIYVCAVMDLEAETMALYISDPEKGFLGSTVSTTGIGSMGAEYPINIGEGGDGTYNTSRYLDFNMADLILIEDQALSEMDARILASAEKPLCEYVDISPEVADIKAQASMIAGFDDALSPFSWVADARDAAAFGDGPFEGVGALRTRRDYGYATLDRDLGSLRQFSLGFWIRINGDVTSDPNIIANKDWDHGYNKGLTLAVKSSGIKLNIGDGINRADTAYMPYTRDQWLYVFAAIDLDAQHMSLYISDPEKGFTGTTVSTGSVGSLGSDYPLNIGDGGDGDYNVGMTLDFNMADLIVLEDRPVTVFDVRALANAERPLGEY